MQNFKYQINGNGIQLKSGSSDQSDVPPQISVSKHIKLTSQFIESQEVAQTVTKTSQVITIMTAPGIVVANFLLQVVQRFYTNQFGCLKLDMGAHERSVILNDPDYDFYQRAWHSAADPSCYSKLYLHGHLHDRPVASTIIILSG
ncbi:hypothetical protein FGO68_gene17673 [Halteria grandinella]|uniref:Uncharacterized protein n=1 Tax=Halteria grandinella TaxID=5974 RepID=A0A8J8P7V4_HALGN|nr:hypothetical protein FGO68_gene17673 [Halteria grandinella]